MVSQTVAEPCPSGPDDTVSRETNIDPRHTGGAADLKFLTKWTGSRNETLWND
jgi:hypothetical protein